MGLRKKVCRRKPDTDSAPPSTAAASSRGSRIFQITLPAAEPSLPPRRMMRRISPGSMETLPVFTFRTSIAPNANASRTNITAARTAVNRFFMTA